MLLYIPRGGLTVNIQGRTFQNVLFKVGVCLAHMLGCNTDRCSTPEQQQSLESWETQADFPLPFRDQKKKYQLALILTPMQNSCTGQKGETEVPGQASEN